MPPIPLYRRLLPWIFFGIFLILAPFLVLYSSGYRYNAKKGLLEQHGTLIIDSVPTGALVRLDGQLTGETTPTTFPSMNPGWHRISVEREGYTSWEKMLEIKPKQVTFANQIHLWKKEQPQFVRTASICRLYNEPTRNGLWLSEPSSATQTRLSLTDGEEETVIGVLPSAIGCQSDPQWREDGQALVWQQKPSADSYWWYARGDQEIGQLPEARYHWEGDELIGFSNSSTIHLLPRTGRLTRDALVERLYSSFDPLRIENTTGTYQRLVIESALLRPKVYELPPGTWDAVEQRGRFLLLRDGQEWLVLDLTEKNPYLGRISGDRPRWLTTSSIPTALFLHGNEIWTWRLDESPELVWRQTEPIIEADWHEDGTHIFIAFKDRLATLELDQRDGRQMSVLAPFTSVTDMAILERDLYLAATSGTRTGLWRMSVE
jgi:hypothetical protein